MALIKWEPFGDLERFFDEDFLLPSLPKMSWDLAIDIYRKDGNVIAEMNVPGVDPKKINITVENNYLKVSGSREEKKETKEKDYYQKEISRGSFERIARLPVAVEEKKAKAEYEDGVLKITIPEKEKKPTKKENVKVVVKKKKK